MTEQLRCSGCGMLLRAPNHYHPYAACLMHRQCKDASQVEVYLKEVLEHGRHKEREATKQRAAKRPPLKSETA